MESNTAKPCPLVHRHGAFENVKSRPNCRSLHHCALLSHQRNDQSVWPLSKRSTLVPQHRLSAKLAPVDLDQFQFRFNNRQSSYLFRDTVTKPPKSHNLSHNGLTTTA